MPLDKFRTGDTPLQGSVSYVITMPTALWFIAEVADCLSTMCDADMWLLEGTVTIDEATQAALTMMRGFRTMIGQIVPYVTELPPDNCLPCDGATYNRVDYPDLYAVLASVFILDADTFKVPDLRGASIIGLSTTYDMGDSGGEAEHTLTTGEIPAHNHTDSGHQHSTGNSLTGLAVMPGEGPVLIPNPIPALTGVASANIGNAGDGGAHNNMPPYVALGYAVVAL